jgi:thiol-disulfide isomerase/thioredoxin
MKMQLKWITALGVLAAGTSLALAADTTLKIGDPAPKLQTGKWIQGEPVKAFQKDKAYIVEFWATWCGPCRQSIPHLNETYIKYKDKGLIVIGQDCWEQNDDLVEPFVKKMGEKMTYRVALDDKSDSKKGAMAETWMAAAGQNGIPTAFIVNKQGQIAWIGHPMSMKEDVLDQVLAGTYDVHKASVQYEKEQKAMAQMQEASAAIGLAMKNKDWDEAMSKVDDYAKLLPEAQRENLDSVRFNILLQKEDYDAAYKLAAKISEMHADNPGLQNELAWQMLTDKNIKQRDLPLAEKIAMRANDAAQGKDANILDTLARARFMQGKKDEAIALQEKAIHMAESDEQKSTLQKSLDEYKKGELSKNN